ncbi:hypothetical protein BDV96DRAFT_653352 [Lophiotrema nucula]|uniref:Zn(2)-C6 fungal-type domain-containing protein n=1 Tax=Lophiotrema nucula TaxID=690887 RepID=A0A6A5YNB1_9PLEO|nr:hypothetical protein BDV96DRAFT_653352 [Lophiotrema nucula]
MPSQAQGKRKSEALSKTNDRPSGKRSRVSRACDQCRTAREKCDGAQPTCLTCTSSNRACSYTTNPKKRGIQPGYIRTLELALTWLFTYVPDSEAALNRKLLEDGASSVLLERDTKESNRLHKSWRRTKFCRDVDKLLAGGEIDQRTYSHSETEDESDAAGILPESSTGPEFVDIVDAITIPQRTHENVQLGTNLLLPAATWRLVDTYFAYTQCWFPICEKHDVLRTSYSYPNHDSSPSGDHAELWSIIALAAIQERTNNDSVQQLQIQQEADLEATPQRLYKVARELIPDELGAFDLGHVKALLNLALANLSQSATKPAWLLVGYASRMLLQLESKTVGGQFQLRSKHVFAGCFLLDTVLSIQLQQRPCLSLAELERIGKISEDGLDEWQPWTPLYDSRSTSHQQSAARSPVRSLSTFNRLVEIVELMSRLQSPNNSSVQETLGAVELWKSTLPPHFDYIRTERALVPPNPPAMLLQLVYNCCALTVFSSQIWLDRVLRTVEDIRRTLGFRAFTPLLLNFLNIARGNKALEATDGQVHARFQQLQQECIYAWTGQGSEPEPYLQPFSVRIEPTSAHSRQSFGSNTVKMPTPESLQRSFNHNPAASHDSHGSRRHGTRSMLLDELLPDMNQASSTPSFAQNIQDFNFPQYLNAPSMDHPGSIAPRDVESFFDDLASLDGAEKMDSQPQFMQNLEAARQAK